MNALDALHQLNERLQPLLAPLEAALRERLKTQGGPPASAEQLLVAARELYLQCAFERARDLACLALSHDRRNAAAYRLVATSSQMLKDYRTAVPCYLVAASLQPKHTGTLLNLGKCLIELQQTEAARQMLEKFITFSAHDRAFDERVAEARTLLRQLAATGAGVPAKEGEST